MNRDNSGQNFQQKQVQDQSNFHGLQPMYDQQRGQNGQMQVSIHFIQ